MDDDDFSDGDPGDGSYGSGSFGDVLSSLEGAAPGILNTATSLAGSQPTTTTPAALTQPQTYLLIGGALIGVLLLM